VGFVTLTVFILAMYFSTLEVEGYGRADVMYRWFSCKHAIRCQYRVVLGRCWQYRPSTGSVLAFLLCYNIFTIFVSIIYRNGLLLLVFVMGVCGGIS